MHCDNFVCIFPAACDSVHKSGFLHVTKFGKLARPIVRPVAVLSSSFYLFGSPYFHITEPSENNVVFFQSCFHSEIRRLKRSLVNRAVAFCQNRGATRLLSKDEEFLSVPAVWLVDRLHDPIVTCGIEKTCEPIDYSEAVQGLPGPGILQGCSQVNGAVG